GERWDRSVPRELIRTGPYAYMQHPLWIAHLLIGIGMIFLLDAYGFLFLLLIIGMVYQRIIEPAESQFLRKYFGETFDQYCRTTPKYIPRVLSKGNLFFGRRVRFREIGPMLALICLFSSSKASSRHRIARSSVCSTVGFVLLRRCER